MHAHTDLYMHGDVCTDPFSCAPSHRAELPTTEPCCPFVAQSLLDESGRGCPLCITHDDVGDNVGDGVGGVGDGVGDGVGEGVGFVNVFQCDEPTPLI